MSDRKKSGCVVAAAIAVAVLVAGITLVFVFTFRAARAGKREALEYMERLEQRAELRAAEEKDNLAAAVELREGELEDHSGYKLFAPLTREMFLSWRLDQGATTLAKETFVEKAEGAEVTWQLQAGDLRTHGEEIIGTFYLPYALADSKGRNRNAGAESIECRFSIESKEALLAVRRDKAVTVRGQLSLRNDKLVIKKARLATEDVEK